MRLRGELLGLTTVRQVAILGLAVLVGFAATSLPAKAQQACGEVITLTTRNAEHISYSFAQPSAPKPQAVLLLLTGGSGLLNFDEGGCSQKLKGNSLVRSLSLLHGEGFVTALVDAPSDHRGRDGLGGSRISPEHATDLGNVIGDLRTRVNLPVFLVGTSRGTISAANAASRLSGLVAADGLVLTSPLTSGRENSRKAWVSQTVFDLNLEDIHVPTLVVAHTADTCIRTPPALAGKIIEQTKSVREQLVMVTGGPGAGNLTGIKACQGRAPHGYLEQEAEVAAGISRFVRGGRY